MYSINQSTLPGWNCTNIWPVVFKQWQFSYWGIYENSSESKVQFECHLEIFIHQTSASGSKQTKI